MTEESGEQISGEEEALLRVATIARELAETDSLDGTLQKVVDLAEGYIEHCRGATLMMTQRDRIITPASTSRRAMLADHAQYATGEGPCLTAMRSHETIVMDHIHADERWPDWQRKISELGWRSMIGLRLFIAEDTLGALNLYAEEPNGFDRHSQALAQVFASHAAVAMKAAISDAGLQRALESRDIIGQAKGVLMEREHLSGQQAFERLRRLSNDRNVKLRDIAQDIAESGEVPA